VPTSGASRTRASSRRSCSFSVSQFIECHALCVPTAQWDHPMCAPPRCGDSWPLGASVPNRASIELDNRQVPMELRRPDHLEDDAWEAIQVHARRLEGAQTSADAGWVIGCAKDLIECVARVVLDAKGVPLSGSADFDEAVNAAHLALERQPGRDVSMSPDIRAIASSAKKMVISVRSVRNNDGSGHGRARVRAIEEETVTVIADATALWVRWALRRLGHILIGESDRLIAELRDAIVYQRSLKQHLEAVMLPDQPPETQHAIGFAFGARAAQDTGNPRIVGIDPAIESSDVRAWPIPYRLGITEGLLLGRWGYRTSTDRYVPEMAGVLTAVPANNLRTELPVLIEKVRSAAYPSGYQPPMADQLQVAATLRAHVELIPGEARELWLKLAAVFEESDPSEFTDDEESE
jgi:abortive infection Abi-like protein